VRTGYGDAVTGHVCPDAAAGDHHFARARRARRDRATMSV
jgi:hypothetical protein